MFLVPNVAFSGGRAFSNIALLDHQEQEGKGGREAESSVMALPFSILVARPSVPVLILVSSDSSRGRSRCPVTDACCLLSQIALKISFGKKPKCEGAILFQTKLVKNLER